jgi:hypothetical protein
MISKMLIYFFTAIYCIIFWSLPIGFLIWIWPEGLTFWQFAEMLLMVPVIFVTMLPIIIPILLVGMAIDNLDKCHRTHWGVKKWKFI